MARQFVPCVYYSVRKRIFTIRLLYRALQILRGCPLSWWLDWVLSVTNSKKCVYNQFRQCLQESCKPGLNPVAAFYTQG